MQALAKIITFAVILFFALTLRLPWIPTTPTITGDHQGDGLWACALAHEDDDKDCKDDDDKDKNDDDDKDKNDDDSNDDNSDAYYKDRPSIKQY